MVTSLCVNELSDYTSRQLNHFFPDNAVINSNELKYYVQLALNRIEFCFQHVTLKHYNNVNGVLFNHLHSDQYMMYLWYLANTAWKESQDINLSNKLYYLNKLMHGIDCAYNTNLPNIFLLFHGAGTVLGKATYNDFFVVLHGCTIGTNRGNYPVLGKAVALAANSSIIGNCTIGDRCTVSTRTTIFQKNIANDTTIFADTDSGKLHLKASRECYAQQFFNVDLNKV